MTSAIVFRIDSFPFAWVDMYAKFTPSDTIKVRERNRSDFKKGIQATQRNGEVRWVTARDLNIPARSAKMIFFDRPFAAKRIESGRQEPSTRPYWLNRFFGGRASTVDDWDWRLFHSLNRTLGLDPDDDAFIVSLTTAKTQTHYRRSDLAKLRRHRRTITIRWKDSWHHRW